jgi:hypothetical protein
MREIVVELSEGILKSCGLRRLQEGIWKPAPVKGFKYRVDPANPQMKIQRHVHIAPSGQTGKSQKISWNVDGSRHDKGSTGTNIRSLASAKRIARTVLNLPSHVKLIEASPTDAVNTLMRLRESTPIHDAVLDGILLVAME